MKDKMFKIRKSGKIKEIVMKKKCKLKPKLKNVVNIEKA